MIEQAGRVLRTEGDVAWVRVGGQSGCSACDEGRGCGAGLFGRLLRRQDAEVRVPNPQGIAAGEPVMLGIEEGEYLALVIRLYGVPLVAGLAGAWLGHGLAAGAFGDTSWQGDLGAALGGAMLAFIVLIRSRNGLPRAFTRLSLRMLNTTVQLDCQASGRNN